ncbi:MAG: universal stress protein [Clostridiales bacterium]|jgi:K+-sensing histidine kinase KdpD|nr:universal stress protein [Clostridiales bacterium]
MNRVLVCITPQANGKRLIDRGAELSRELSADLHILHVETSNSIFSAKNAPEMLEKLFRYGTENGGEVHAIAGGDQFNVIERFIIEHSVTDVILGEAPENGRDAGLIISQALPHVRVTTVEKIKNPIYPYSQS